MTGAFTGYIDVAQLCLYAFWLFFFGLVYYLLRENKREGYPLVSDRTGRAPRVKVVGWPDRYTDPRGQVMWDTVTRLLGMNDAPSGRCTA